MRTKPKDKKPNKVYYIYEPFEGGAWTGPYSNKPSKKILDKHYKAKIVVFKLVEE